VQGDSARHQVGRIFPRSAADIENTVAGVEEEPRGPAPPAAPFVRPMPKVGRNEPCPCGSGRKYKHCHGALQQASG